jgi:RNA polymerase sigma-70 factor (ECF subfamily)
VSKRTEQSDRALVRRLLAGEDAAFEEFFAEYFPRVYRFARARLGGNDEAAEEVVQTTLIRALDRLETFRGEAALFTWLCALCRREVAGWFERKGRVPVISLFDSAESRALLETLPDLTHDDPEAAVQRREISRLVHTILDELPGRYADALEWKYIHGLSVADIAARLGLGYKATESLLTRARLAFRDGFKSVLPDGLIRSLPGLPEE